MFLYCFNVRLPTFILATIVLATADFSPSFNDFLTKTYGKPFADRMARRDIGPHGSYGGGEHQAGFRTSRQAVVLVHGITNTAGRFQATRRHLLEARLFPGSPNGWGEEEVYATTYGDGGKTPAPLFDMKCDYIRQIRWLIQAVAEFTKRRVDVIGYSMGAPVARKAILGGRCVDTGERLGPPMTGLIDTFVSVAGANRGSVLCLLPFPGACNMVNGLSCNSAFLKNINSKQRYEGRYIYSIYSRGDDKRGGNHDQLMANTIPLQARLIDAHSQRR
ncbi:hypothetical protein Q1695_011661 [Nippostrongylus brasiliensis]|nr:hypothetical protein Q1695_011661 [Nippostrongylus brasiliensis]